MLFYCVDALKLVSGMRPAHQVCDLVPVVFRQSNGEKSSETRDVKQFQSLAQRSRRSRPDCSIQSLTVSHPIYYTAVNTKVRDEERCAQACCVRTCDDGNWGTN